MEQTQSAQTTFRYAVETANIRHTRHSHTQRPHRLN